MKIFDIKGNLMRWYDGEFWHINWDIYVSDELGYHSKYPTDTEGLSYLAFKWRTTGLMDGLNNENMEKLAILFEKGAKELIANSHGKKESANIWPGIIRKFQEKS